MKSNRYTLRALALLLNYPDDALRQALPELLKAIDDEAALPAARRAEIRALAQELVQQETLDAEARYVETFDRGRSTSLHLFEHVHGDSRDRGPAMIDLLQTYEAAGLSLRQGELPDYLPVLMEFASTQPTEVARSLVGEVAHIVNRIAGALQRRRSPYADVLIALLLACGQRVEPVEPEEEEPAVDASWAEPQAFGACPTAAASGSERPVHFVRQRSAAPAQID